MFQNTSSQAMVRVISTARCWASGDNEMTTSKKLSSRSSKLFGRCRASSMPISSITATAKPSISRRRTPTESTNTRCPCRCFRIASAIGERTEFMVQQNNTAPGVSATALHPRMCRTQISVNSRRAVAKSISIRPARRSRNISEPSLCRPRRPMSMASMRDGGAVLMALK